MPQIVGSQERATCQTGVVFEMEAVLERVARGCRQKSAARLRQRSDLGMFQAKARVPLSPCDKLLKCVGKVFRLG